MDNCEAITTPSNLKHSSVEFRGPSNSNWTAILGIFTYFGLFWLMMLDKRPVLTNKRSSNIKPQRDVAVTDCNVFESWKNFSWISGENICPQSKDRSFSLVICSHCEFGIRQLSAYIFSDWRLGKSRKAFFPILFRGLAIRYNVSIFGRYEKELKFRWSISFLFSESSVVFRGSAGTVVRCRWLHITCTRSEFGNLEAKWNALVSWRINPH